MNENREKAAQTGGGWWRDFFVTLIKGLVRDATKFLVAFALGTGAGAIVCWYYGLPLALSLLGGFLVLGIALALLSDSLFS